MERCTGSALLHDVMNEGGGPAPCVLQRLSSKAQEESGPSTNRRQPHDLRARELEVCAPWLGPWIEQHNHFPRLRIVRGNIESLKPIAPETSVG